MLKKYFVIKRVKDNHYLEKNPTRGYYSFYPGFQNPAYFKTEGDVEEALKSLAQSNDFYQIDTVYHKN